ESRFAIPRCCSPDRPAYPPAYSGIPAECAYPLPRRDGRFHIPLPRRPTPSLPRTCCVAPCHRSTSRLRLLPHLRRRPQPLPIRSCFLRKSPVRFRTLRPIRLLRLSGLQFPCFVPPDRLVVFVSSYLPYNNFPAPMYFSNP